MRTTRWLTAVGAVALLGLVTAPASVNADADGVTLDVLVDGTDLEDTSSTDPVVLDPGRPTTVDLRVTNTADTRLDIRTVRLEGKVAGLPFFAYEIGLRISVEPGATESRAFELDLAALDGQAVGLLPATVRLLDADRSVVASQRAVVDVRGSMTSVYALWGLVAAGLCAVQLVKLGLAVAGHRLPANRWRRGMRFASLGTTIGMLVVFYLSTLRIVAPHGTIWIPVVGGAALAMFLLGYVSPFLDDEDDEEELDELVGAPRDSTLVSVADSADGLDDLTADGPEPSRADPRATNRVDVCPEHPMAPSAGRR